MTFIVRSTQLRAKLLTITNDEENLGDNLSKQSGTSLDVGQSDVSEQQRIEMTVSGLTLEASRHDTTRPTFSTYHRAIDLDKPRGADAMSKRVSRLTDDQNSGQTASPPNSKHRQICTLTNVVMSVRPTLKI